MEQFRLRDLDALLNSLVNIDRNSLIAILSSEAEVAQRSVDSARQRTASQRAKRDEAVQRAFGSSGFGPSAILACSASSIAAVCAKPSAIAFRSSNPTL